MLLRYKFHSIFHRIVDCSAILLLHTGTGTHATFTTYSHVRTDQSNQLNQALPLQVLVCLSVVHVPLLILYLFHRFLSYYFLSSFVFEFLSDCE